MVYVEPQMASTSPVSRFFAHFPDPGVNVYPWLIAFFVLIVLECVGFLISQIFMLVITYTAGKGMFKDIMIKVSQTTFHYYDVVPIGRLMNRMTSDVATIDGPISNQFLIVAWQAIAWVTSIAVIAGVTPLFLAVSLILTLTFVFIFMQFLPTSQSLRRLEMVSLSPLMSNFGALLNGLTTVRAFCAQSQFQNRVIAVTDAFQGMDHFYWYVDLTTMARPQLTKYHRSLQAWLMYRYDILSAVSTFIMTLLAIYSGLSPGLTAFVLASASRFVVATHGLCKQYGQLQLNFVSVERVVELLHLEQEPPGEVEPPAYWPSYNDDIVFEDVTMRYAPHLDPALSDVSFTLKGGSNTAVIGRTGSGKSTLALSLLATMIPESGKILIGGIDIAKVNKQALRNRITFLAQEPVLFPGSLRHNLDPTEQHTDEECETVIARVCGTYSWTLTTQIDTGGKNLSQGQRQMVGLARAVLRRSAIVIMDEATASIDKDTAWEIQRVLREEMKQSTVVTIAHRPSAVRGAEFCLVLGNGRVVDQGKPEEVDVARSTVPDAI
jgi:ABC-type multidrug transport system fused ATPase/permease subunit